MLTSHAERNVIIWVLLISSSCDPVNGLPQGTLPQCTLLQCTLSTSIGNCQHEFTNVLNIMLIFINKLKHTKCGGENGSLKH